MLTDDRLARALALYQAGASLRQARAAAGISWTRFRTALGEAGIPIRDPAAAQAARFGRQPEPEPERVSILAEKMASVYDDEERRRWILRQMGVN